MKAKLLFLCFIWLLAGCGSDPFIGELKYVLKVEQQGQGKIIGEGAYSINQTAVLRAYPDSVNNYTFQGWLIFGKNSFITIESFLYKWMKIKLSKLFL